jgi:hypothetical protein
VRRPGPLRDASWGDPGLVCPRFRYLIPSARDRGQRGSPSRYIQERNRARPQQIDKASAPAEHDGALARLLTIRSFDCSVRQLTR